jgi:hypothetical protein
MALVVAARAMRSDDRVSVPLDDPDDDHPDGNPEQQVNPAIERV